MFPRDLNILPTQSFLLFGARGSGKTSYLQHQFEPTRNHRPGVLWIDLLRATEESRFSAHPDFLLEEVRTKNPEWIVIDEVQKIPKLLDIAHLLIEERGAKFALTGSSARKLKRGSANLLAGRAFIYNLFPFTHRELGNTFSLDRVLQWGALPKIFSFTNDEERTLFLEAYGQTYVKEEVLAEQLTRNIVPFRRFIQIAAQTSGTIINFSKIATEIDSDPKTVKKYYEILEDTLLGHFLPGFHRSLRRQQRIAPKFFLFDGGVRRALEGIVSSPCLEGTYEYGRAFESFIVTEAFRLNAYRRTNYRFSYLHTAGGAEVDLVIERPGLKSAFVEIKSSRLVTDSHLRHIKALKRDFPNFDAFCFSQEPRARSHEGVTICPWQEGFIEVGL